MDGTPHSQEAIPIRAVDTVGAGDAFVAGYIAEMLNDQDVPQRLLTAVRTARSLAWCPETGKACPDVLSWTFWTPLNLSPDERDHESSSA